MDFWVIFMGKLNTLIVWLLNTKVKNEQNFDTYILVQTTWIFNRNVGVKKKKKKTFNSFGPNHSIL